MCRRLIVSIFACLLLARTTDAASRYKVIILNPPGWWWGSIAEGISGGHQVGFVYGSATGSAYHACLWSGTPESRVDLHPSGFVESVARDVSGDQQVGYGKSSYWSHTHALLWSGTPESYIDLHPQNVLFFRESRALGVSDGQQVGYVEVPGGFPTPIHALLWSGTPESYVDLHPSGFKSSSAADISGNWQVGSGTDWGYADDGTISYYFHHALLWNGSSESCMDLHPAGFASSWAWGISDGQQVGCGIKVGGTMDDTHALLWSGTAESCVDLHPSGFLESGAYGVASGQQVGYAVISPHEEHASLWSGTPESHVDLHTFLPPPAYSGLRGSTAYDIDSIGNIVGEERYHTAGSLGYVRAVMWVPLPDVVSPVVSTSPATDVTKSSSTLNGILTDDGGEACQYRFRYRDGKGSYIYTPWTGSATTGELFSQPISDLNPNTTYYFNAQARNSAGESDWGNEQSFIAYSIDFEIDSAQMVSPDELGIDIVIRFPQGAPDQSPRKIDFWANVNGKDVKETFNITRLIQPGQKKEISFDYGSKWIENPVPPRIINFDSQGVPRFGCNVGFRLYGAAYWEGGQYSDVFSIPVEIPLPVIIIHGVTTYQWQDLFMEVLPDLTAYDSLQEFLTSNGYNKEDTSWYRTLWGPREIGYSSQEDTADEVATLLSDWIKTATERTYADKVNIVGHSLGGLIGRYYAWRDSERIHKVIMIGTPNEGSSMFYYHAFIHSAEWVLFKLYTSDVPPKPNLRNWLSPTYLCLYNTETGEEVPNLIPNLFHENGYDIPAPDGVRYYSIYNSKLETPRELWIRPIEDGTWYEYVDVKTSGWGDKTVLRESTETPYADPMEVETGTGHAFLPANGKIQSKVLEALRDGD